MRPSQPGSGACPQAIERFAPPSTDQQSEIVQGLPFELQSSMTSPPVRSSTRSFNTDNLVMLSRELQAMITAGVPLDFGLAHAAPGFSRDLADVSERVAERLQAGASLADALAEEDGIPPAYRAILVAGLRCNRSESVLEDLCEFAQTLEGLRRTIRRGMVYPTLIVVLATALFAFVASRYFPMQVQLFEALHLDVPIWLSRLSAAGEYLHRMGPAIAVILLGGAALYWVLRTVTSRTPSLVQGVWWIPGIARVLNDIDLARMTHLLTLLTNYQVPLPEALQLAASASSSRQRATELLQLAESVEQGGRFAEAVRTQSTFPNFLKWLIETGAEREGLSEALRQASAFYRDRASVRAEILQRVVPSIAVIVVGGGITLVYGMSVFVPMFDLWTKMGTS